MSSTTKPVISIDNSCNGFIFYDNKKHFFSERKMELDDIRKGKCVFKKGNKYLVSVPNILFMARTTKTPKRSEKKYILTGGAKVKTIMCEMTKDKYDKYADRLYTDAYYLDSVFDVDSEELRYYNDLFSAIGINIFKEFMLSTRDSFVIIPNMKTFSLTKEYLIDIGKRIELNDKINAVSYVDFSIHLADKSIVSIFSFTTDHIPLLKQIRDSAKLFYSKMFFWGKDINPSNILITIRMYTRRKHIHIDMKFVNSKHKNMYKSFISYYRDITLDDLIARLENGDQLSYYQRFDAQNIANKKSASYEVCKDHPLFSYIESHRYSGKFLIGNRYYEQYMELDVPLDVNDVDIIKSAQRVHSILDTIDSTYCENNIVILSNGKYYSLHMKFVTYDILNMAQNGLVKYRKYYDDTIRKILAVESPIYTYSQETEIYENYIIENCPTMIEMELIEIHNPMKLFHFTITETSEQYNDRLAIMKQNQINGGIIFEQILINVARFCVYNKFPDLRKSKNPIMVSFRQTNIIVWDGRFERAVNSLSFMLSNVIHPGIIYFLTKDYVIFEDFYITQKLENKYDVLWYLTNMEISNGSIIEFGHLIREINKLYTPSEEKDFVRTYPSGRIDYTMRNIPLLIKMYEVLEIHRTNKLTLEFNQKVREMSFVHNMRHLNKKHKGTIDILLKYFIELLCQAKRGCVNDLFMFSHYPNSSKYNVYHMHIISFSVKNSKDGSIELDKRYHKVNDMRLYEWYSVIKQIDFSKRAITMTFDVVVDKNATEEDAKSELERRLIKYGRVRS
jgi:hypothetical protein